MPPNELEKKKIKNSTLLFRVSNYSEWITLQLIQYIVFFSKTNCICAVCGHNGSASKSNFPSVVESWIILNENNSYKIINYFPLSNNHHLKLEKKVK